MPLVKRRSSAHGLKDQHRKDGITLAPVTSKQRPVSSYDAYRGQPSPSRLSHELRPDDIAPESTDKESARSTKRFSMMRFRNFSESQLSTRARLNAERPPVPAIPTEPLPTIVKTAPTTDNLGMADTVREEERQQKPSMFRRATSRGRRSSVQEVRQSTDGQRTERRVTTSKWRRGKSSGLEDLQRLSTLHKENGSGILGGSAPPSYGDVDSSALALPVPQFANPSRNSESSRSDGSNGSSGSGPIYGSTTTTTHTVSTHTTFFKLPRRNKKQAPLFPLPVTLPPPNEDQDHDSQSPSTPRASAQSFAVNARETPDTERRTTSNDLLTSQSADTSPTKQRANTLPSPRGGQSKSALTFAGNHGNLFRNDSQRSFGSGASSPLHPPMRLSLRNRSSTHSSLARSSHEVETPPPRTSTSTAGRSSLGGLLSLSRFRQSSEPHSRNGSPGLRSHANSFAISRETLVIPEREEGDTPGKYLERLESAVARSVIAGILSKSADPFAQAVLRSYTRRFPFFGEPIDMSLRKFLLEAELPKETQQVDRVVQAFADRYHECNPGIFANADAAYIIAFSIMMLHTDAFNKNNKRKMQKQDYIKNTSGQGLDPEILGCFYDNICYTPFVHFDEDVDLNGERVMPFKAKSAGGKLKAAIPGSDATVKKPSGPVDPYNLLVEQKLDTLRPPIKDSIMMDDPYDYRGGQGDLDPQYLQRAFTHTGVLQIISARSRPAAYENQVLNGDPNPVDSQQGIVDLKVTKVGTLWRKAAKRKKTRSPWQEWGAILTGSQLYLFKNPHWTKSLVHQFMSHQKPGHARTPVTFKPPIQEFKYDALIKTDDAVALVDSTYNRHKNAFVFVRPGGIEEVLLADNESELNEWLGLINYAAAFRAAGVRIRGMVGGNEEDQRAKEVMQLDSTNANKSIRTAMGESSLRNRGISPQLQKQVMAARRQIMVQKIGEIEQEVADANRRLEGSLRNARHLLLLAPISQRSREDVVHAAAKKDVSLHWARRDVWRLKCHRDILAMDVRLDGLSASELEKLTRDRKPAEPESARKEKPNMLARLSSSRAAGGKSPPRSPITAGRRPSDGFMTGDVFRTPSETLPTVQDEEAWRLPPLNLDLDSSVRQHRTSVTSTLLSSSPPLGAHSLAHSSSTSSVILPQRTGSIARIQTADSHETPSWDERQLEMLARTTMRPEDDSSKTLEGQVGGTTPETRQKGVRRSLHKTLRDHHSSGHKHRRNKDSESTVRSGGLDDQDLEEGTPGLAREKPRFILHGKQASVVQFGGDWERMRVRREQYGAQNPDQQAQLREDELIESQRADQNEMRRMVSVSSAAPSAGHYSEEDDNASMTSEESRVFREDAEAAAAFATAAYRPPSQDDQPGEPADDPPLGFDVSDSWDPDASKRQTVIGPSTRRMELPTVDTEHKATDEVLPDELLAFAAAEAQEATDSSSSVGRDDKRTTVIGPCTSANGKGTGSRSKSSSVSTAASFISADETASSIETTDPSAESASGA
ncbi:unnamed protein product [Zymoseptoria tritici ST99CH_1E4]|uniref:SEC7 domain-containing protein n=1 Tax=Zymoseptoria tritici ST99CH_1E4 TaxID=1276532 RepID=A0A2H1G577_ZYMTR|nr:unnamed protein product [Zymoseptoria tritici ST99CH_1E4]